MHATLICAAALALTAPASRQPSADEQRLYDGVLFVGDAMVFKQGRLDPAMKLFDAHPDENKASIRALQKQIEKEEIDIVCTGHGGCTPKGMGSNQLTDLIARL